MILEDKASQILNDFSKIRILVIGDIMFDHYIWGNVSRISPEAPVPVVHVQKESQMPGGAANVISNLHALGIRSGILGIVGKDTRGSYLKRFFNKLKVNTQGLITDNSRPTIEKTRIIAHSQQVVRVDREKRIPLLQKEITSLIKIIRKVALQYDAIILEDYGKGVIIQEIVDAVLSLKNKKPSLIISYDPKKDHDLRIKNIDLGTPNLSEAESIIDKRSEKVPPLSADKIGKALLKKWKTRSLFLTSGEKGMSVFEKGKKTLHIPTVAREVYDVSGAGDTVIATATACLSAGASARQAAILSNFAAGIVVGKLGTQTVTRQEILNSVKPV